MMPRREPGLQRLAALIQIKVVTVEPGPVTERDGLEMLVRIAVMKAHR
jgi:hypothetical protein